MTPEEESIIIFDSFPELTKRLLGLMAQGYRPLDAYKLAGGMCENVRDGQSKARQILTGVNVVRYRTLVSAQQSSALMMDRAEAVARLSAIARARLDDILRIEKVCVGFTDEGEPMHTNKVVAHDSGEMSDDALAALAEVSQNEYGIKIKMHSPLIAIKQLTDLNGWEPPKKHEISGLDGQPIKIVATTAAEAAASYQDMMG